MRIEEIRVDGYGTLADVNIGELPVGLTIISGDNEAGKSTLLDFVRGVLFGFPNRNRRLAYHVPLRGGRHGGAVGLVDDDGARWHLERHVGAGDALLTTADGLPASHETLQKILGNADDALFRNIFAFGLSELSVFDSLDREEVRDIVFSAGVLGAGRSARRATTELEALRIALVRPRKGDAPANALSRRIGELDVELKAARRKAEGYPAMLSQHCRQQERVDDSRSAMEATRERSREVDLLLSLWPIWRGRLDAESKLEELGPADDQGAAVVDRAADIRSLGEARSGHVERMAKHAEHLGAIETAEAELQAIARHLGHTPSGTVPLVIAEEIALLKREGPETRAALRASAEIVRKATNAERGAAVHVSELSREKAPLERIQIERRLSSVQRLEAAISRERLLSERVTAQRNEAALRRQLALRQRGGADSSSVLGLITIALVLFFVGAATTVMGRHHGASFIILGALGLVTSAVIATIGLRLRHNLAAIDLDDIEFSDPDLDATRLDLQRLSADLALDTTNPLALVAAGEALQRELARRQVLDVATQDYERLAIELSTATAHYEELRAAVEAIDDRVAQVSTSLGFERPLGIDGLEQGFAAIVKANELSERIARIRRADEAIRPGLERFESLLVATESALGLGHDDDPTRRVRRLEAALELASANQATRARLSAVIREATERLIQGLGTDDRAERLHKELSTGEVAAWEIERRDVEVSLGAATSTFEVTLGELRDAERELEQLRRSSDVIRLGLERGVVREELDDVLEQWLIAGAARALLERCLTRYEVDRQPKVISYAAELFSEVTEGRYSHLIIDEEDDGARRHVVAMTPSGERVDSGDLSRGTAEQLYLCLRLGFAASFAEQSVSLPLVLDDILVNFDPRRAAAVARIFGRVAEERQVIAFTCHPHVIEMFRQAVPDLRTVMLS